MGKSIIRELKIYENIKHIREMKNISRQQIADELELSLSGYAKLERGEIDASFSRIQKIANILEVELVQLINFDAHFLFNSSTNQNIQGIEALANKKNQHSDDFLIKYVKKLEEENERLKKELDKK